MSAQPKAPAFVSTALGQFCLIATGEQHLPFQWVEHHYGHTRTMATFVLATDAIQLLDHYQARETREAAEHNSVTTPQSRRRP